MNARTTTLIVLGVFASLAFGFVGGIQSERSTTSAVSEPPFRRTSAEGGAVQPTGVIPSSARRSPQVARASSSVVHFTRISLPPTDMPVLQTLTELEPAAKAGNPHAACRLASDLQKCASAATQRRAATAIQSGLTGRTKKNEDQDISMVAQILNNVENLENQCAGVRPDQLSKAFGYLLTAAESGNEDAQRIAAINPPLDRNNFVSHLDDWVKYEKFAETYFDKALKNPHLDNLLPLIAVYQPIDVPGPAAPYRRHDPAMFLALVDIAKVSGANLPAYVTGAAAQLRSADRGLHELDARNTRNRLNNAGWDQLSTGKDAFRRLPALLNPAACN